MSRHDCSAWLLPYTTCHTFSPSEASFLLVCRLKPIDKPNFHTGKPIFPFVFVFTGVCEHQALNQELQSTAAGGQCNQKLGMTVVLF